MIFSMGLLSTISIRKEDRMNKFFIFIFSFSLLGSALAQGPNMNFTGDASVESANYRMNLVNGANQTGGAWYPQLFDLDSAFFLDITFASAGAAEGWAIVLYQGDSMPVGPGAEQLGVPTSGVSFITEFDFQQNGSLTDGMVPHVSFFKNGSLSHLTVLQDNVLIPDLDATGESLRISWDADSSIFSVLRHACTNSDITYVADLKNDIFGGNSNVYIGFTAATSAISDSVLLMQHFNSEGKNTNESICLGDSVVLQSNNGTPMKWIVDEPADTILALQDLYVSPLVSTYYKRAQNGICDAELTVYDSVYVEVNPTPNLVITDPAPVCSPMTIDLTAFAVTAGSTLNGGPLSAFIDAEATIAHATPTTSDSGTYYIVSTTPQLCSDTAQVNVLVNPSPNLVITDPVAACSPETVDLTAAVVTAGSNLSGGSLAYYDNVSATSVYATPATADLGTYYIVATTPQSCADTAQVSALIIDKPIVAIQITNYVETNTADISVDISGGVNPISTAWTFPDNSMVHTEDLIAITPGDYELVVSSGGVCETTKVVSVEVSPFITDQNQDYFSPNGDGEDETIIITVTGESEIVNSAGQILRDAFEGELWDGTNQHGVLQPSGVYLVIGETSTQTITLLR